MAYIGIFGISLVLGVFMAWVSDLLRNRAAWPFVSMLIILGASGGGSYWFFTSTPDTTSLFTFGGLALGVVSGIIGAVAYSRFARWEVRHQSSRLCPHCENYKMTVEPSGRWAIYDCPGCGWAEAKDKNSADW